MQLVFLAIVIVVFCLSWKYAWIPTAQGYNRDKLVIIGYELSDWVKHRGVGVDNQQFVLCYNFVNSCICYIETYMSCYTIPLLVSYKEFFDIVEKDYNDFILKMKCEDEELNNKIRMSFEQSVKAVRTFVVMQSFSICVLLMFFVIIAKMRKVCNNSCDTSDIFEKSMNSLLCFLTRHNLSMSQECQTVAVLHSKRKL